MVLFDWKVSTNDTPGNDQIFGGADFNRVSRLLNGEADVGLIEINSDFSFLQDRAKFRNLANVNEITLNANASQAANVTVAFPLLSIDDTLVVENQAQTFANKTFNITDNSLTMTGGSTGDLMYYDAIAGKMTRLARGSANQVLQMNGTGDGLLWGAAGAGGSWNPNLSETITNKTVNLTNNTLTDSSIAVGDLAKANSSGKFVRFPRGTVNQVLQCTSTDVTYGLIGDSNITPHITSKITTTAKTLLNTAIVYNDQNNFLGAFYQDIGQIATPSTPLSGRRRLFANSDSGGQLSIKRDDGTVISLEASAWSPTLAETLTNKKIDAATNTLDHVAVAPSVKKVGYWHATGTPSTGSMLFNDFLQMPNGTATFNRSNTVGTYQTLTTGSSNTNTCSIKTNDSYTARALNPTFKARFRVPTASSCRVGLGLNSDMSFDQRNSDWLSGQSGAAFVYGTGRGDEASIYFTTNNGGTNSFYTSALATLVANTVYTIELKFDNTNNKVQYSFNGGAFVDVTTQVPASATLLGATWGVQTTTGSSRTLDVFYTETTSDK